MNALIIIGSFLAGGMTGIFFAAQIASGKLADERDAWNRFISEMLRVWEGNVEELRQAWDARTYGRGEEEADEQV